MKEIKRKPNIYFDRIKDWAKTNPKIVYFSIMTILSLGFIIMIIRAIFEEKESNFYERTVVPTLLQDSDREIRKINEREKKGILSELDKLKKKEILTTNDSIRIRFLIDKYNVLSNE